MGSACCCSTKEKQNEGDYKILEGNKSNLKDDSTDEDNLKNQMINQKDLLESNETNFEDDNLKYKNKFDLRNINEIRDSSYNSSRKKKNNKSNNYNSVYEGKDKYNSSMNNYDGYYTAPDKLEENDEEDEEEQNIIEDISYKSNSKSNYNSNYATFGKNEDHLSTNLSIANKRNKKDPYNSLSSNSYNQSKTSNYNSYNSNQSKYGKSSSQTAQLKTVDYNSFNSNSSKQITVNSKKVSTFTYDTLSNKTTETYQTNKINQISSQGESEIDKNINEGDSIKFIIYINCEYLNLMYKTNTLEEFSTYFRPFLEIGITNASIDPIIIMPFKESSEVNKDLNSVQDPNALNPVNTSFSYYNTNLTELDTSMLTKDHPINPLDRTTTSSSLTNTIKKNQKFEKSINFKSINAICVKDFSMRYQNLIIILKNGFINTVDNDQTDDPIPITIGEGTIPIDVLTKKYRDEYFLDGYLEIKIRNVELIGSLKVKILVSENVLKQEDEKYEKFFNSNNINNNILDMDSEILMSSINSMNTSISIQKNLNTFKFLNFSDMDPILLNKNLIQDSNEEEIIFADKILKNFYSNSQLKLNTSDFEKFLKIFKSAVASKNLVQSYLILVILCELSASNETEIFLLIEKFLFDMNENENEKIFFLSIHNLFLDNIYILKTTANFFYNYEKYYRTNKTPLLKFAKILKDKNTIKSIFEILNHISEISKNPQNFSKIELNEIDTEIENEFKQEIRDCTMMCLNTLSMLVSQSKTNRIKKDEKILENSMNYSNSISIISLRNHLLKLINKYVNDSQIILLIFKIFRKSFQNVMNPSLTLKDLKNFQMEPIEFGFHLKKILLKKGNGIFFTSLKLILIKYHHYPDLHSNTLAIISYLTYSDSISQEHLSFLRISASLLNLNLLKDIFEIFRWRFNNTTNKLINHFHFNVLSNFSQLALENSQNSVNEKNSQTNKINPISFVKIISSDLKNFFYYKIFKSQEKLKEILMRKKQNLEIHSLVCKIGANVTRMEDGIKELLDSLFFEDIIEYMIYITYSKNESSNSENKNGLKLDFLLMFREKKKNISFEQIKKFVYVILQKSTEIILNVLVCSGEVIREFIKKLNEFDIKDLSSILELIKDSKLLLEKYGMSLSLSEEYIQRLSLIIEKEN